MDFGDYLRNRRRALHLSLEMLATQTQTSPSYLSRIERGMRNPPQPAFLKKLAPALHVDYVTLLEQAGHLNHAVHLHESTPCYQIDPALWKEAERLLSDEDWADIQALLASKTARKKRARRQNHPSS
ncbi:MAG: helix-turn-helix transcriptional regulator [Firmicutes bacterium]|nr:helix-turn-helix transcriptional regulator [Bacillota bacterium]